MTSGWGQYCRLEDRQAGCAHPLAFLPKHFTEPLIRAAIKSGSGANLLARDLASIKQLIMQVRKEGYAFNEGHLMPGVSAAAFPLMGRTTTLVAVLAVMGRHERVNPLIPARTAAATEEACAAGRPAFRQARKAILSAFSVRRKAVAFAIRASALASEPVLMCSSFPAKPQWCFGVYH